MMENDKKKISKSVLNIPGTKLDAQNGQLLISSGIPSLDELLGGGLPVGTVALVEEDSRGLYSKIMLKYFLAEGIVNKHPVAVATEDCSAQKLIKELPAVISSDPESSHQQSTSDEKMTIAFRYQNLPTSDKQDALQFGHHYDLSNCMPQHELEKANISYWKNKESINVFNTFSNPAYHNLLQFIKKTIKEKKCFVSDKPEKRSVLRIGLHSLGSPMWLPNNPSLLTINKSRDMDMFIFCLRALLRSALAVAVVTVPSHLHDQESIERCIHSSDVAVRLQGFTGTELENNSILSEYSGYFHLIKLAAINTLASKHPGSVEYVFKLRRKKFSIEKLRLPPSFEDSGDKNEAPSMSCGSSNKHLLEF